MRRENFHTYSNIVIEQRASSIHNAGHDAYQKECIGHAKPSDACPNKKRKEKKEASHEGCIAEQVFDAFLKQEFVNEVGKAIEKRVEYAEE